MMMLHEPRLAASLYSGREQFEVAVLDFQDYELVAIEFLDSSCREKPVCEIVFGLD